MRSAATLLAALAALAPSIANAASPMRAADLIPRFAFQGEGPLAPTVTFALHGGAIRGAALLGRSSLRVYRALPEIVFSIRPAPGLELFVGGAAGPAFVVRGRGLRTRIRETDLALSASLGARSSLQGVPFSAFARAESVVGKGAAMMLRLKIQLGSAK